ncbi:MULTISPECIES: hypothetical protein [Prochlorococcus]|uniref:hypothetical protein n=1 Tax=Prochlorococcus TaxID=1218 RepID=UPI000533BABB|nr:MULTISPECIES: hypothetical protein [Prochlorococcus]KGG12879.1 hypothetical protein EV05_0551 [Prochlorococcus sp. MIT 0601]
MIRPRWQNTKPTPKQQFFDKWNKAIAFLAVANLAWAIFDISYIQLRSFWVNKKFQLFNIPSLEVSFYSLPNITARYDKIKGVGMHQKSQEYIKSYQSLDNFISKKEFKDQRLEQMLNQNKQLIMSAIDELERSRVNTNINNIEMIKKRLVTRIGERDYKDSITKFHTREYIKQNGWSNESKFLKEKIIPKLNASYILQKNQDGRILDYSWKLDLPFQLLFLINIILQAYLLKIRFRTITWKDAIIKQWGDILFFTPFLRLLRIFPTIAKLSYAKLIQIEPLRAAISQWVVAVLAIELFEVLTVKIIDSFQQNIQSNLLPNRIRGLCSYKSPGKKGSSELKEFLRLWMPLLLKKIGPNMRAQLIALLNHSLQKSIESSKLPIPLRDNQIIDRAESVISMKLASSMADVILGLSKNTGERLSAKDYQMEKIALEAIDKFWEELASSLEEEAILSESQELITSFLEGIKIFSFRQFKNNTDFSDLIIELDDLNSISKNDRSI